MKQKRLECSHPVNRAVNVWFLLHWSIRFSLTSIIGVCSELPRVHNYSKWHYFKKQEKANAQTFPLRDYQGHHGFKHFLCRIWNGNAACFLYENTFIPFKKDHIWKLNYFNLFFCRVFIIVYFNTLLTENLTCNSFFYTLFHSQYFWKFLLYLILDLIKQRLLFKNSVNKKKSNSWYLCNHVYTCGISMMC